MNVEATASCITFVNGRHRASCVTEVYIHGPQIIRIMYGRLLIRLCALLMPRHGQACLGSHHVGDDLLQRQRLGRKPKRTLIVLELVLVLLEAPAAMHWS